MFSDIVILWILLQMGAPWWCYVLLAIAVFARCLKAILDSYKD